MKINDLQINGFGKLSNKKIKLEKNINIIQGKNESGKSTLLNFIKAMFYGLSKSKNGKDISDFEKYLPWKTEEFSGKISYELDNGENYEVYREFKKKNPVIYNKNKQDITLNYNIDKIKGINYIYNQLNIDEDTFKNTVIIEQDDIKINKNVQNILVQKISNIITSGDESVSYKKTLEKINKMQIENVGTDRTREKPINILNNQIEEIEKQIRKIDTYKNYLKDNELDIQNLEKRIENEEIKNNLYRVIKESKEKSQISKNEIDYIRKIRDEYFDKIEELDDKIDKKAKDKIKNEKRNSLMLVLSIMFVIISVICLCFNVKKYICFGLLGVSIIISIIEVILRLKFNKNKKEKLIELEKIENRIEQEIDILRNNIKERQAEIDIKQGEIKEIENEINRLIMNSFEDKLNANFIEEAFELEYNEIESEINNRNDEINKLKIEISAKQNQKNLMQEEINNLVKFQEKLNYIEEEKKDLLSLNNSYNLVKEGLENAYEIIRNSLSPNFINTLNEIISNISNKKYENINFIDTDGLIVQVEDGRFLPVERLSHGTIDQMYLGLRLASIDTISKENLPIILDETFVFFDNERLKNILSFLNENYKDRQIIIFTCSNREIEILNKLNIDYNYIDIEN